MGPTGKIGWKGALVGAWLLVLAAGAVAMERYARTPGAVGVAEPGAPGDRARVTMHLHPRCPCSGASIAEFAGVIERFRAAGVRDEAPRVVISMYRPGAEPDDWARGRLWEAATRIPGAIVVVDPDGVAAERDGALTSGHVVVRGPDGGVVYSGGITIGRGERGASGAADRLLAAMRTGEAEAGGPVFGCPIVTVCGPEGAAGSER